MFCTNCGKEIPNESKFCKHCGNEIKRIQENKNPFASDKIMNTPIEKIYDINGAYEVFKAYNGLANNNCIFYAVYEKPITPAEVAAAALLVGAVNAAGMRIIRVKLGDSGFFPGYLINQTENGVGLIALEPTSLTPQFSVNKMRIVPNSYVFINKANIKSIRVKDNPLCLDASVRFVTIDTFDGVSFHFRVSMKNKYLAYQESNFLKFMYNNSTSKTTITNKTNQTIDRIDWHWDAVTDASDEDEHWEKAGAHIGYYIEWAYKNGFAPNNPEVNDVEECQKVINSEVSGIQFLIENCDTKFWSADLNEEGNRFTSFAYNSYVDNFENIVGHKPYTEKYNQQDMESVSKYLDKVYEDYLNNPPVETIQKEIHAHDNSKKVGKIILIIFLIGMLATFIYCIGLALSLSNKDNSTNSIKETSNGKNKSVNVTMYKP